MIEKRNPHITREAFCDWLAGEMELSQEEAFLGHIGSCTFCSGQFADWMEESQESSLEQMELPHEPPAYLKEEILQRTQQMDVQMAVHVKEKSQQMQLFMYSLKVGLAVMTSIFLLMLTANIRELQPEIRSWKTEQMQQQRQERETAGKEPDITGILNQKSGEISSFLNEISNGLFRIGIEEIEQEGNQEVTR